MIKVKYSREERDKVLAEHEAVGLVMVEEWNHVDGDFLFFLPAEEVKVPPAKEDPIADLKKRLAAVEADVGALKKAGKTG